MTSNFTELHMLTGAYAMNALPDDERRRFEDHLDVCEACVLEVAELRDTTAQLGAAALETPPQGLRERILLAAKDIEQVTPASPSEQAPPAGAAELAAPVSHSPLPADGPRDRQRPYPSWVFRLTAAAAVVLAIAVTGLSLAVVDLSDQVDASEASADMAERTAEQFVELLAAPDAQLATAETEAGASARVVSSSQRGEAIVVAQGLEPIATDSTYQLWLIGDEGARPAGLLETGSDGRATELVAGDLEGIDLIGVTVEPAGGSPQPTTEPVLAIALR